MLENVGEGLTGIQIIINRPRSVTLEFDFYLAYYCSLADSLVSLHTFGDNGTESSR